MQFVETARKLAVYTRQVCMKLPKRWTFFGVQKLCEMTDEIYALVKMANSVFPSNAHEVQIRRDYLIKANSTLQAFIGEVGIIAEMAKKNNDTAKWIDKALQEWADLIEEEAILIAKVKKTDKERFSKIK